MRDRENSLIIPSMKVNETNMPDGLVFLNFKTPDNKTLPKASELPTLITDEVYNALRDGDQNQEPLLVTEAIDFPVEGSGGVYTKEFFASFLNRLKAHVFGGNKLGHSWPERDDFFTIGGSMKENADGKSGTVYLKIYIPSFGFETTNSGFIRSVKAKNVHYSLVTFPSGELCKADDGEYKMHFLESVGYERNDAVPFEGGAMKQRVNASEVQKINFELARELISNGKISREDNGEEFLVKGNVSRPMLRRLVANADCDRKTEIGELISMIDKTKNGGKPVELKEALEMVKNAAANGTVNLVDLMKNCGAEKLLRNEEDDKKIAIANAVIPKLGDKPLEKLDVVLAENEKNAEAIAENAVADIAGKKTLENGNENPAFTHAMKEVKGKTGEELENALEALKDDAVMKILLGNMADPNSSVNVLVNDKRPESNEVKAY